LTMGEYPGPCERSGSETSREGLGSKKGSMGIFPSGHFSFATLGRSFRKISKSSAFSGSVFLSLAQCAFALSGYLVNVGLARFLGPTGYGQYGVTISVLTWLEILLSTQVLSISESGGMRTLRLKNTATGRESDLSVSGIFVIIGLEPAIGYLRGLVEVDGAGFIRVDHAMRTSLPGIFAAGDIRSGSIWQAIAAAGDGAVAARSAEKYLSGLAR